MCRDHDKYSEGKKMNMKIVAVAIAAIVCVGAVAVYFGLSDGDNDGTITIVDGNGKTISLDAPLENAVVVNTNVPKAMKILGLEEKVVGIGYASATTAGNNSALTALFPNLNSVPYTKDITGESMAEITSCVICPVASMTLSADQEADLNNLGVIVVRLDCFGDTALEDLEKLTILFGETDSIMQAYSAYIGVFNDVVNTVKSKVAAAAGTDDKTFLYYMESSKAFYNQTSEAGQMIEIVYGKNALRSISNISLTGVTSSATDDGLKEAIRDLDDSKPIDKLFIRGKTSTSTTAAALTVWNDSVLATDILYSGLSVLDTDEIYVFNSNMMSGTLSYVGYILLAEVCGIDTGYDVAEVIGEYNSAYGFSEPTTGLVFNITIVEGTASATKLF